MIDFELQKSIDLILGADNDLLNLLGDGINSIIDNPSQQDNIIFPFIRYDGLSQQPWFDKTTDGARVFFLISAFSRSGNKERCARILDRIYKILHKAQIEVDNYKIISCLWSGTSNINVDDTVEFLLFHGTIEFEILVEEV